MQKGVPVHRLEKMGMKAVLFTLNAWTWSSGKLGGTLCFLFDRTLVLRFVLA